MESWIFLAVGGLGATGAALSLGTLAALVRYRRTGTLPGQDEAGQDEAGPAEDEVVEPEPGVQRRLVIRIVIGAVVAAVCAVTLAEQGLLAGPF